MSEGKQTEKPSWTTAKVGAVAFATCFLCAYLLLPQSLVNALAAAGLSYVVWLYYEPETALAWVHSASELVTARVALPSPMPARRSLSSPSSGSPAASTVAQDTGIPLSELGTPPEQVLVMQYNVAPGIARKLASVARWVVRDFIDSWTPMLAPAEPSAFAKYIMHVITRALGRLCVGLVGIMDRAGGHHVRPSMQLTNKLSAVLSFHVRGYSIMARRAQARCPQLFMPPPAGTDTHMRRLWAGARDVAIQHEYHLALTDIATAGLGAIYTLHHPGVYRDDVSCDVYAHLHYAQAQRTGNGAVGDDASDPPSPEDAQHIGDAVHPVDYLPTVLPAPAAHADSVNIALDRYLQRMATNILQQLLTPADLASPALRMIANDIVTSCVLHPLVDLLSDPYTLNSWLAMLQPSPAATSETAATAEQTVAGATDAPVPQSAPMPAAQHPGVAPCPAAPLSSGSTAALSSAPHSSCQTSRQGSPTSNLAATSAAVASATAAPRGRAAASRRAGSGASSSVQAHSCSSDTDSTSTMGSSLGTASVGSMEDSQPLPPPVPREPNDAGSDLPSAEPSPSHSLSAAPAVLAVDLAPAEDRLDAGGHTTTRRATAPELGGRQDSGHDALVLLHSDEDILRAFLGAISAAEATALLAVWGAGHAVLRGADSTTATGPALVCSYTDAHGECHHLPVFKCSCAAGYTLQSGPDGGMPQCKPGVCPTSMLRTLQRVLEPAGVRMLPDTTNFDAATIAQVISGHATAPIRAVAWPPERWQEPAISKRDRGSAPGRALRGLLRKLSFPKHDLSSSIAAASSPIARPGCDIQDSQPSTPAANTRGYLAHITGASGKLRAAKPAARGQPQKACVPVVSNVRPIPARAMQGQAAKLSMASDADSPRSPAGAGARTPDRAPSVHSAVSRQPMSAAMLPPPSVPDALPSSAAALGAGVAGDSPDGRAGALLHNLRRLQHGSGVASLFAPSGVDKLREQGGASLEADFYLLRRVCTVFRLDPPTVRGTCLLHKHVQWRMSDAMLPTTRGRAGALVSLGVQALYTARAQSGMTGALGPGLFGSVPDATQAPLPLLGIAMPVSGRTRAGDERLCNSRGTAVRHTVEVWIRGPPPDLPSGTASMWSAVLARVPEHKRRWRLQYRYTEFVQLRRALAAAGISSRQGDVTVAGMLTGAEASIEDSSGAEPACDMRLVFPGKRGPLKRASNAAALHQRRVGLQAWLRALIALPGPSAWADVRAFLVPSAAEDAFAAAFAGSCATCAPHLASPSLLASVPAWEVPPAPRDVRAQRLSSSTRKPTVSYAEPDHVLAKSRPRSLASSVATDARGASRTADPSRMGESRRLSNQRRGSVMTGTEIGQLELATFDLVSAVFDLHSANILRRGILSAVRVVVRTFFSSTTAEAVRAVYRTATSLDTTEYWLEMMLESLWPGGQWPENPAPLPTPAASWAERGRARQALEALTPPALVGLLGREAAVAGLQKLHGMAQCPAVTRSMALMLLDEILNLVLPDVQLHDGHRHRFEVDRAWQATGEEGKTVADIHALRADMTMGVADEAPTPDAPLTSLRNGVLRMAEHAVQAAKHALTRRGIA